MIISKDRLREIIERSFRDGMLHGYGVDHENIVEDENRCVKEYLESIEELRNKKVLEGK